MRIAIVLSRCHRFGSSRYVLETLNYFTKKNHEVHIFANTCDKLNNPHAFFHPVPTLYSWYSPKHFFKFMLREISLSIAHTINMKRFDNFFDITLAQPTRYFSPMIGEMQFVYREWFRYKKKTGLKCLPSDNLLALIEKHNIMKAKKLITLSHNVKNTIISNYGTPEEKIVVAYSGVNSSMFTPKNRDKYFEQIRTDNGIDTDDILLIFVGNPYSRKGLDFIVKSLPLLKEDQIKLLIVGKDNPQPYIKLAKSLGVENKIKFERSVLKSLTYEIWKYYPVADIFVLPTLYEPFGLVILEAMASGIPVITSKFAGAAEIIGDGKEGFLLNDPTNEKEIAEKLNSILESDSLRKRMGVAARKKAEKYTWERSAKIRLATFEEVVQGA